MLNWSIFFYHRTITKTTKTNFSRSTGYAITIIAESFYYALYKNGEAHTVPLDISKPLTQDLTFSSTRTLYRGTFLSWEASSLSNREMEVVVTGYPSTFFRNNANVSRGHVLFPTLFLIFIDGLPENISSQLGNSHYLTLYLTYPSFNSKGWSVQKGQNVPNNHRTGVK